MFKKPSFKIIILSIFFIVISLTVVTSYFSVNYVIGDYINKSETQAINKQLNLVKDKLVEDINNKIILADNLNFSFTGVQKVKEKSGFHFVVKVVQDYIVTSSGPENNPDKIKGYVDVVNAANGKIDISNLFYEGEVPLIRITIPRTKGNADIFYVDLSSTQKMLSNSTVDGSYMELLDSVGNQLFSNVEPGELLALENEVDVQGKPWKLTGFVNQEFIQGHTAKLNHVITVVLLIAIIIIIPISIIAINIAFKPIVSLHGLVTDLAQGEGDLTRRLEVKNNDHLGKIAGGINLFTEKLQGMIQDVSLASQKIEHEIKQVSDKTESNQQLLDSYAQETDLVVSAIAEMSSSADSIAQSAASAAELTQQANHEADQSKEVVSEAVNNVSVLVNEVSAMSDSISVMSNDTEEIATVLSVIGDIADQTNLLALNAAIEAARAGEQGRGFAVVADEVRALASRTQKSTSEINDMLGKLRSGNKSVVEAMSLTQSLGLKASATTEKVTESLDTVSKFVSEISVITANIATSAEEQSSVSEEISQNMKTMQEVSHNINQNGQETAQSTLHLSDSNTELIEILKRFKIS